LHHEILDMKKLFFLLILLISFRISAQNNSQSGTSLPSALIDGRFFLKIPTKNGDTLLGFCDTGGGYTAIYKAAIKKLGIESKIKEIVIDTDTVKYISANEIYVSQDIPYPQIGNYYKSSIQLPFFEVPQDTKENIFFSKYVFLDAFLGQFFFIQNAWTFDYKIGQMSINTPLSKDKNNENIQVIGFKKDKYGNKRFGHPSMKLEIDGKIIDFLFDTGATFLLSNDGRTKLGVNSKSIAGSFIAKSLFDKWHEKYPQWRVIEKGEVTGADLIEVPLVKVGDLTAGPVWFAKRPDEAWSKGMIGSMDKVVKGAIGGSFLQYFKVIIDYNNELIKFEK
jgi:hypothetical protein